MGGCIILENHIRIRCGLAIDSNIIFYIGISEGRNIKIIILARLVEKLLQFSIHINQVRRCSILSRKMFFPSTCMTIALEMFGLIEFRLMGRPPCHKPGWFRWGLTERTSWQSFESLRNMNFNNIPIDSSCTNISKSHTSNMCNRSGNNYELSLLAQIQHSLVITAGASPLGKAVT